MTVIDKQNAGKYVWGNSCDSFVLVEQEGLSVKQEVMPPGAKEQWHYHARARQFFYILEGEATFHLEGETHTLRAQQGLHVAPGQKHFIANNAGSELGFLVISQPSTKGDRIEITDGISTFNS